VRKRAAPKSGARFQFGDFRSLRDFGFGRKTAETLILEEVKYAEEYIR